jgi:hypothetical protein
LACSKTPTCAPSTPRESPSCRRMSNWREESEANALKCVFSLVNDSFTHNQKQTKKWKVFFPPSPRFIRFLSSLYNNRYGTRKQTRFLISTTQKFALQPSFSLFDSI